MNDAEVTAYLIGSDIGRKAVGDQPLGLEGRDPIVLAADPEGLESYRRLGSAAFKGWVLRGVQDAMRGNGAVS